MYFNVHKETRAEKKRKCDIDIMKNNVGLKNINKLIFTITAWTIANLKLQIKCCRTG